MASTAPPSLESDSKITRLDASTYAAHLHKDFCVMTVPNGGYVATIFLKVASAHLAPRNQPDTIAAQWQFLNRTEAGPATLVVEEAKLGRTTSVLHISLYQGNLLSSSPWVSAGSSRAVVAYITNGRLAAESGVTLPTQWHISHPPPPADLARLPSDNDPNWKPLQAPLVDRIKSFSNTEHYALRAGPPLPTTHDMWIRLASGEPFTPASLAYVADVGPPLMVESFRPARRDELVREGGFAFDKGFWYPTLSMSLDVKKPLPEGGAEWLRLRTVAKVIRNGRYDAELLVFDDEGDLVAISHHVVMAVDVERNYAKRIRSKV